jgi:predicted nuclease with TOPRIM domain
MTPDDTARLSREMLEQRQLHDRIKEKEELLVRVEEALIVTHNAFNQKKAELDALLEERGQLSLDAQERFRIIAGKIPSLRREVEELFNTRSDKQHDQFELWRQVCELHELQQLRLKNSDTEGSGSS